MRRWSFLIRQRLQEDNYLLRILLGQTDGMSIVWQWSHRHSDLIAVWNIQ